MPPISGNYRPSSDTPTHLELYKAFPEIGGIVHTHSSYATSWAQAGRSIPCYGTTHADYIYGEVPCLRCLTKEEIDEAYEENTGHLIVNEFRRMGKDVTAVPAVRNFQMRIKAGERIKMRAYAFGIRARTAAAREHSREQQYQPPNSLQITTPLCCIA